MYTLTLAHFAHLKSELLFRIVDQRRWRPSKYIVSCKDGFVINQLWSKLVILSYLQSLCNGISNIFRPFINLQQVDCGPKWRVPAHIRINQQQGNSEQD